MKKLQITNNVTFRNTHAIDKYLCEVNKSKILSPEEENDLFSKIKKGDTDARNKLINSNLRFVISVAKQYQNQGLPLEDLINEGNIGLLRSIDFFDTTKGFKFISYAVWWIRQSIIRALSDFSRTIRLPSNRLTTIHLIDKCVQDLEQKLQRSPEIEEIADAMKLDPDIIKEYFTISQHSFSTDFPLIISKEGKPIVFYDTYIPKDGIYSSADTKIRERSLDVDLCRFLNTLTQRESLILSMYYGLNGYLPMTMGEISNTVQLTPERIRQIKCRAIHKLMRCKNINNLKDYL